MKIMARENCYDMLTFYVLDEEGVGFPILTYEACFELLEPKYLCVFNNENWTEWTTVFLKRNKDFALTCINVCMNRKLYYIIDSFAIHEVIPANKVDFLISVARKEENYEAQVILMKYKDKIGGYNETIDSTERFKL